MSKELELATLMRADGPLMDLLTGGVWTGQEVGVEGIRRGDDSPTNDAFDPTTGALLPCALVRDGNESPYGDVRNMEFEAINLPLFIHFYEMRGHEIIDQAKDRAKIILSNQRLGRTYPIWWVFNSLPVPDSGPVQNSTTISQIWNCVYTVRRV